MRSDLHFRLRRGSHWRGFTLVEALLSIVIISAIALTVAIIVVKAMESYKLIVNRREALQSARLAMNMMEGELQTISDPATDISSISPTAISFTSDGDAITYSVSGSNLLRKSKTLASGIVAANTGFEYFTAGGATTSNPAQVHRIHIRVEIDTGQGAQGRVQLNSSVYLRNRYYHAFSQI